MSLNFLNESEMWLAKQIVDNTRDFYDGPDTTELYEKLYEHYVDEMPYGTAKARTGDPAQWLFELLEEELS